MALTPYALELVLNYLYTNTAVTRPTAWYLAWHIGPPGDDGTANEQTVGGDANYVRQAITFGTSAWSTVTKKQYTSNTNVITITPAAATSYTIYGFSVWDAATGGNCLIAGDTKAAQAVSDVAPVTLIAGKVPVTLSREQPTFGQTSHGGGLYLDWLLTADVVTRPAAWYISLHTGEPGDNGAGNEVTAGDDPAYVRQATDFANAVTAAGGDTFTRNSLLASWVPGAGANYTAPYIGIWDAMSGGNCINTSASVPERAGVDGQTLSVAVNDLTVTARQ